MGAAGRAGRGRIEWRVAGAAAGAAVLVSVLVVSMGPQAGAAGAGDGVRRPLAAVTEPTSTETSTPTPTATPTPTPTPTATPIPVPTPTDVGSKPLLPNLRSLRAKQVTISTSGGVRRLRFSSTLADVGVGPLEILPQPRKDCPKGKRDVAQAVYQDRNGDGHYQRADEHRRVLRQSGCMEFHPSHNHWHVDASARYWLTEPGVAGSVVRHSKVSFCLRDSHRLPDRKRKAVYGFCTRDKRQGITPGWGDVYQWFLPGQSLVLPKHLPAGLYCLHQRSDPLDVFRESDETDNDSVRALHIRGTTVHYRDNSRCR